MRYLLMSAIEDCKQSLDNNVGWVLMDLSKAFDALPQGLMLAKLHAYGITNSAYNFISDYMYLSFRSQRVQRYNYADDNTLTSSNKYLAVVEQQLTTASERAI